MSNDDEYKDPSRETNFRWQREKETLGENSSHDPPPWNVGDQLNDFVLEKLLGSGSSGFVYRALDVKTNRRCALKLLKHGPPDDLLRNKLGFRRMISIEHPQLLRVDRIYQLGSYVALSMEEVDGVTFKEAVRELRKLDPQQAHDKLLKIMRDFASGLAVMHANGYIHRDIKPENLMVDRDGNGRVIDYGLVELFDLDLAPSGPRGFLVGTPHYFAPEVIWSQRYLPAGDIFSLGIVMLDALASLHRSSKISGVSLERSETDQLCDAERIDDAIDDLAASVPGIIREACREMLDRAPAERPTAMQLARLGLPRTQAILWPHEEPVIGRESEQREIHEWVDEVFNGDVGRLHITGRSGIGKTRLIEEVIEYIESKHWGQVFNARCRVREDQPLQAFDQICDAITNRYMKGDRERLELDPVSAAILQNIFPVLENVMTCCMKLAPAGTITERLDALEAAARMSAQLRLVGPLFLIVDDAQWADRDSLNVLDRLQSATGEAGLGIITVSRESDDPQRMPASKYIQLEPLRLGASIEILSRSACRWSVDVADTMLRELAEATKGSPFRLREMADEFRPGGVLAEIDAVEGSTTTQLVQLERLWQRRTERLSDDARRVLTYAVTAGGRVSTQQLGELTGLGDSVDVAVSELASQRLITDEATGGECITVFHDHVADELIRTLSGEDKRKAHHAWASLLVRQDNPQRLAARIAGHFFAAQEPGRAVAHAILAAEDAERRVATTEAARWYARAVDHVEGQEKINQLRNASRCYTEADFPVEAAEYYQRLAKLVDGQERIECQLLATTLLIRSGRFSQVRDHLQELARTLGLPKPKPSLTSQLSLVAGGMRLLMHGKHSLVSRIDGVDPAEVQADANGQRVVDAKRDQRQIQRLKLCLALARPMSMFDCLYAAELNVTGSLLSLKHGDAVQRAHVAIGEAVFACYDKGRKRISGEMALSEMKPHIAELNSARATADLWAGIAFSHALACRWDHVSQPVRTSIEHYRAVSDSHGFETAHVGWLDLWTNWNLGRWDEMQRASDAMFQDSLRRNDLFQRIMTTGGFGGAAWLARDKADDLKRIQPGNAVSDCDGKPAQLLHVFDWIASIQALLYEGRFADAWTQYQSMEPSLRRMPFSKLQLVRVSGLTLGVLTSLHNLRQGYSRLWIQRARRLTRRLRREQNGFARVLANLYEGLLHREIAKVTGSKIELEEAERLLMLAQGEARDRRLRPFQLAAGDALAEMHTGQSMRLLADRMRSRNVVRPDRFQRLYTLTVE